jgi:hypothetical protein
MQTMFNVVVLIIEFLGVGTVIALLRDFINMRKEQAQELSFIKEGNKCQLRSELLKIYYHCIEKGEIRQYELENFITLYKAYKALGGNSFIDRIYQDVIKFRVVS